MGRMWSRWFTSARRLSRQRACSHIVEPQRVGAGLARGVCTLCGAVRLMEAQRPCWATTVRGHQCLRSARSDSPSPLCTVHDAGDVEWITTLKRAYTVAVLQIVTGSAARESAIAAANRRHIETPRMKRAALTLVSPVPVGRSA